MSKKFETIRYYYVTGLWDKEKVRAAVGRLITKEEFLISRKALLEALEKERFPGAPYVDCGIKIAIRVVENMPGYEEEEKEETENFFKFKDITEIPEYCFDSTCPYYRMLYNYYNPPIITI